MKRLLTVIGVLLLVTTISVADELQIPFSAWPKEIQIAFAETGRKLDLSGNDRTEDSWGFIENKGSNYTLFTYRSVTKEDFEIIMKITSEVGKDK